MKQFSKNRSNEGGGEILLRRSTGKNNGLGYNYFDQKQGQSCLLQRQKVNIQQINEPHSLVLPKRIVYGHGNVLCPLCPVAQATPSL